MDKYGKGMLFCDLGGPCAIPLEGPAVTLQEQIAARVVDLTDEAVYRAAIECAREEGVTKLALLDRRFVLDALWEKAEREYRPQLRTHLTVPDPDVEKMLAVAIARAWNEVLPMVREQGLDPATLRFSLRMPWLEEHLRGGSDPLLHGFEIWWEADRKEAAYEHD